jgi:hypothetical protein
MSTVVSFHEAGHQQPGAHEQHQRRSHLEDHQSLAKPASAKTTASALARILQGLDEILARGLQRRHEARR